MVFFAVEGGIFVGDARVLVGFDGIDYGGLSRHCQEVECRLKG